MVFVKLNFVIICLSIANGYFYNRPEALKTEYTTIAGNEIFSDPSSVDLSENKRIGNDVTGESLERESDLSFVTSLVNTDFHEDLLDLIAKSFTTFEEDLQNGCIDKSDLQKLLQEERKETNQRLLRFFFLTLMFFFVCASLSIYAIVESRRKSLSRSLSKKAVFRYKKSFVNESEATPSDQYQETDSAFQFDKTSFTSNSLKFRSSSSQSYAVAV